MSDVDDDGWLASFREIVDSCDLRVGMMCRYEPQEKACYPGGCPRLKTAGDVEMAEDQAGYDMTDHYSVDQSLVAKAGKEMAERHWAYIEKLLRAHLTAEEQIDIARHHYVSAFVHGYGHGWEERDRAESR